MADFLWRKASIICSPRDICAVYRTAAEQQAALLAFSHVAISCGARVVLVGKDALAVCPPGAAQGQVLSLTEAALAGSGRDWLPALAESCEADGFAGGQWLAVDGLKTDLTAAALRLDLTVLSLYNAAMLTGNQMLPALQRHAYILIADEVSENELYLPPADCADPNGDTRFADCYQRLVARRSTSQESLARDQAIANLVSDAIALVAVYPNQPMRVIEWSGKVGGASLADIFGSLDDNFLFDFRDLPLLKTFFDTVVRGEDGEVDFRVQGLDTTWVRLVGRGVRYEADGSMRLYLAARDIDWRKRTELELAISYTALGVAVEQLNQANNSLREKQRQLDLLLHQAPVLIWTTDQNLVFTSTLGRKDYDWGFRPEPVAGKPLIQFFADDTPVLDSHYAALNGETTSIQANFGGRSFLARIEPLRDAAGAVVGVIGVALDITEQQQAEEALLLTQAFNRSLLDASIDTLVLLDRKGCILALNGAAAKQFGRPVEVLIRQLLADQWSPDIGQSLLNDLSSVTTSCKTVEHTLNIGEQVLRVRMDPIVDPQGTVAQAALLIQDISPFLRAELAERRRREVAEILRSVSEDLTRTTSRQQVLQVIVDGVRWLAPELSAHVLMLKEGLALLECYFQHSSIQVLGDLRNTPPLPVEAMADLRMMYRLQKPVLINDVQDDPEWVLWDTMNWIRSYAGAPIVIGSTVVGFITLASELPNKLNDQHVELIQALAGQAAVALQKAQIFTDLEEKNKDLAAAYSELEEKNQALAAAYDATIAGWARALELRDKETEGHSQRVVTLTMRLIECMQVPKSAHHYIRWGALLHDIGKMGIPDNILLKADQPLTDQEWLIMKLHPTLAYEMLAGIDYLRPALDIPYSHHEWWDGTGYPLALKGEAIPLSARIFSVVDAWDALTNQRPYRPAWSPWRVARHIRGLSGRQFDPQVVNEFLKMLGYE